MVVADHGQEMVVADHGQEMEVAEDDLAMVVPVVGVKTGGSRVEGPKLCV